VDEWESPSRNEAWAHLSGRRHDGFWSLAVVDETDKRTNNVLLDVRDLVELIRFATRELVRHVLHEVNL
jgi:hypothetical protein